MSPFWLHPFQVSESFGRSFDREKDSWIPGNSDRTLGKLPLDIPVSETQPFHLLTAGRLMLLWSSVEGKCFFLAHAQWKRAFASGGLLSGWRGFIQSFLFLFGEVSSWVTEDVGGGEGKVQALLGTTRRGQILCEHLRTIYAVFTYLINLSCI